MLNEYQAYSWRISPLDERPEMAYVLFLFASVAFAVMAYHANEEWVADAPNRCAAAERLAEDAEYGSDLHSRLRYAADNCWREAPSEVQQQHCEDIARQMSDYEKGTARHRLYELKTKECRSLLSDSDGGSVMENAIHLGGWPNLFSFSTGLWLLFVILMGVSALFHKTNKNVYRTYKALFPETQRYKATCILSFSSGFLAKAPQSHPILSPAPDFVPATHHYSPISALGVKDTAPLPVREQSV